MKKIIVILALLIGGPVLMVNGIKDYNNGRKLLAQGKVTIGQVVDGWEKVSRKGRHSYSLTVAYQTEKGESLKATSSVSSEAYKQASATGTAKVHYLPSEPAIVQVGEKVEADSTVPIIGACMFLGGLIYVGVKFYRFRTRTEAPPIATEEPTPQIQH